MTFQQTFALPEHDYRYSLSTQIREFEEERLRFKERILQRWMPFLVPDRVRIVRYLSPDFPLDAEELWIDGRPVGRFRTQMDSFDGMVRWTFSFEERVRHDGKSITGPDAAAVEGRAPEGTPRAASTLA